MLPFLKSIPQIFYSRTFYADLFHRGRGIGAGFILLQVLLTFAIPFTFALPALPQLRHGIEEIVPQIPTITIKDQKLSIDRPSPYVAGNNKVSIIFDTTPRETNMGSLAKELKSKNAFALVTADYVAMRKNDSTVELIDYSNINKGSHDAVVYTQDNYNTFVHLLFVWGVPFVLAVGLCFLFVSALVGVFFRGLILKVAAYTLKMQATVPAVMRLSAAAMIPVSVVEVLQIAINRFLAPVPRVNLSVFVTLALWASFAIFGLLCARKETQQNKLSDKNSPPSL